MRTINFATCAISSLLALIFAAAVLALWRSEDLSPAAGDGPGIATEPEGEPSGPTQTEDGARTPIGTSQPAARGGELLPRHNRASLTDAEHDFISDFFAQESGRLADSLRSLRASGLTGLEYARKEADLLFKMSQLDAMEGAYKEGVVELSKYGEVVGDNIHISEGYVVSCTDNAGRQTISFPVDFVKYPYVRSCKERLDTLRDFVRVEALAEFNARPLDERVKAAKADRAHRLELVGLWDTIADLHERLAAGGLQDHDRNELSRELTGTQRRITHLMRQILIVPVDPQDPEMRY